MKRKRVTIIDSDILSKIKLPFQILSIRNSQNSVFTITVLPNVCSLWQSIHYISRRFEIKTDGVWIRSNRIIDNRSSHAIIIIAISHIYNQSILIIILEYMVLSFIYIVFFKSFRDTGQIKESNIYQINTVLYLLALCPLVTPVSRSHRTQELRSQLIIIL